MKRNLYRLLALTLLLTFIAGTFPALAAAKVAIVKPETFWQGDWQRVMLENLPKGAAIASVKSSRTDIIQVVEADENRPWMLHALAGGKSRITVRYTLKSGAAKSVSATFTIKKYPNAIKYIKLNGKKLPIKPAEDIQYLLQGYNKTATRLTVAANTGWKIEKITLYLDKIDGTEKELDVTKKNGKSIKTPRSYHVIQYLILFRNTKTGVIYHSVVTLFRQ
jgi:hypothetical protein